MSEYCKINTAFKRDSDNIIMPEEYSLPEFKYLENNLFECTEKIDGTNMRIELQVTSGIDKPIYRMCFKGRTDKAVIPKHLEKKMHDLFDPINWNTVFPNLVSGDVVTIYGEGYGYKIQEGHNYLDKDVNFILFDVKVNKWWLSRESCEDVSKVLNIDIVPLIGNMTLLEAIDYVKKGFKSTIAINKDYDAEGLVLKPLYGLNFRNGNRIILKLKTRDFIKYNNKINNKNNG